MRKIFILIGLVAAVQHASSQNWLTTGNAGTTPGTNFLGTTDARALMFKVNAQQSGLIDFSASKANAAFGFQALKVNTGNNNAAFGYKASFSNTSGLYNTAAGAYALFFNTTGYSNAALGIGALYRNTTQHNSVAVGDSALYNNGQGATFTFQAAGNTAVGSKAMYLNTKGYSNTALGFNAIYSNTTGYENTANGYQALYSNTGGASNTASGYLSLYTNTTGSFNTALGDRALRYNTSGGNNTAVGYLSLHYNTTGGNNTATGVGALYFNSTGSDNDAYGKYALENNTTGYSNIAIGTNAMFSNTTGYWNTSSGYYALNHNTAGYWNTALGAEALYLNTSGTSNTAVGVTSLYGNTTGLDNTALGNNALTVNTTGSYNTALGLEALLYNNTGYFNTAVGVDALYNNTTAYYNCAVGYLAMAFVDPGYNNTAVGSFAGPATDLDGIYNTVSLGTSCITTASNQARIGNSSTTSIGGYTNWSNISDGRVKKNIKGNVPGLAFINKLKPVTYNLDLNAADKITQGTQRKDKAGKPINPLPEEVNARKAKEQILYSGFVAQDVEKSAKELSYDFSGVDAAKNDKDLYGLRYAEFVVPLVKAVQELSQQNDELKKQNELQQKEIDALKAIVIPGNQLSSQQLMQDGKSSNALLGQNVPNPFDHSSAISYTLPQRYSSAKIIITDKTGKSLKEISLSGNGRGTVQVDAAALSAGTYQYTLYVDGRLMDTKQMILTK